MKRSSCLFLALLSLSFESSPTPTTALLSLSPTAKGSIFCGTIALLFKGVTLIRFKQFKKKAEQDPFPDSPEKRKLTEKLAKEGYEVHFVKGSPAVYYYRKKVVFFLPCCNEYTFFNDPYYAPFSEAIIAHEIAHVRNGDISQKACFIGLLNVALGHVAIEFVKTETKAIMQSPLFSRLLIGLKLSPAIKKNSELALRASAALLTGGATLCGIYGVWLLAQGAFCQHLEQRADAAVVTLEDPLLLEETAKSFGQFHNNSSTQTWKQWFTEKTASHPSNASRALFFRKEAAKMRKRQLSVQ